MTARHKTPDALLARLAELGIPAETHRHARVYTVEESKALRGDLPGGHCKSLFLKDKKDALWLVVALEDRAVDLNPHSPDEHMSCKWVRIDSDISIRSLCRWIEDNHGAPSG